MIFAHITRHTSHVTRHTYGVCDGKTNKRDKLQGQLLRAEYTVRAARAAADATSTCPKIMAAGLHKPLPAY